MPAASSSIASDGSQVLLLCMQSGVKRWRTDIDRTKTAHTVERSRRIRRESMQHRQYAGYAGSLLISV